MNEPTDAQPPPAPVKRGRPKKTHGHDPYTEGHAAALAGKTLNANPFEPGSEAWELWNAGHADEQQ